MRLTSLALIICLPLVAKIDPSDWAQSESFNEEESFFLRRIADFWQEGEYGIAKKQMEQFLSAFPESQFADLIRICLGDILLREKNFSGALTAYSALSSQESSAKTFLNRMQCLYGLEWYSTLADECEEFLKQDRDPELKTKATFYLAISLYYQCLNTSKEPEVLLKLAKRAEPYFETLIHSERSFEITQAFAHLCCILKDYEKAANIYLDLAASDPLLQDEMTFQAALIQAEYDKELALQSFEKIINNGQKRAKEAAFKHLVLSFETGQTDAIANNRESILASVPEDRKGMARLFIGRSLLNLKKYSDAIGELRGFLNEARYGSPESIRSALISLIEAAYQSGNLDALDLAIAELSDMDPLNEQIAKGKLLRSQLLKKLDRMIEARKELEDLLYAFANFPDRAAAIFECADLEYQSNSWENCRAKSLAFLKEFPNHELAPHVWRYFAVSSSHLVEETLESKERLASDLEFLLKQNNLFSAQETNDWKFYLAQAYFHLGWFEKSLELLQSLLRESTPFPQQANARLLLGLCHREGKGDLAGFCLCAETALAEGTNLIDKGFLHLSLFNAYLELSHRLESLNLDCAKTSSKQAVELIEKSAEHLYEAFRVRAEIVKENLLWLGEWYITKGEHDRASDIFSAILEKGFDETACYKLAQVDSWRGRTEDLILLMEKLISYYKADPEGGWKWEREAKFLLAQAYEVKGLEEEALNLLSQIINNQPAVHSETIAKAYLEKAKIASAKLMAGTVDENQLSEIGSQFKNLVLQRRFDQEPIHLEAALEYVDLFERYSINRMEKRLTLLEKIKKDFQNTDDLLSKDYHQARLKNPEKNRIFEEYMRYIDEEILMAKSELATDPIIQKELQAKAKDLLLQMKGECTQPTLVKRVISRLQSADVSVVK